MPEEKKYHRVNWIDGMKINKNHFIQQDNAGMEATHEAVSLQLSSLRYGLVSSNGKFDNFIR